MPTDAERACDCAIALRCADMNGPVAYDPIFNEFHLVVGGRRHRMTYCFNCGGKLPDSTRGRRFTAPSLADCEQLTSILHRCRCAADVLHELGPSDAITDWNAQSVRPIENRPCRRQFVYTRRWRTLVLVVMEYADGSLSFGINGQPIVSGERAD